MISKVKVRGKLMKSFLIAGVCSFVGILGVRTGDGEPLSKEKKAVPTMINGQYGVLLHMTRNMLIFAGNKKEEKYYCERIENVLNNLESHDADYEKALTSDIEVKIWADVKAKRALAEKQIIKVRDLILSGKVNKASELLDTEAYQAMNDAQKAVDSLQLLFL